MSLKETFEKLKTRLTGDPATKRGAEIRLDESIQAKTSDNVFVTIPCHLVLTVANEWLYREGAYQPREMAPKMVGAELRKEIATLSLSDLQQATGDMCDRALQSVRPHIEVHCGLRLVQVSLGKVEVPGLLPAVSAAAMSADQAAADATALGLTQGLETGIKIKKPLSLKKPGQSS